MIRMLIRFCVSCLASVVGLLIAAAVLDQMTVTGTAFLIAALIFTVTTAILQPLFMKIAMKNARALMGGTALVTTLAGLIITSIISDGLSIRGATTWIYAMVIVWLATMLANWILPMFLIKEAVQNRNDNNITTFGA
jgi:low temperature requirement protein LtrA